MLKTFFKVNLSCVLACLMFIDLGGDGAPGVGDANGAHQPSIAQSLS